MAVEVIRLEVQQHRDPRPEVVHVLELEARDLADDRSTRLDGAVELAERAADVPRDRRLEHRPEPLARRGLAVRAGHGDEWVVEEAGAELQLAPDLEAPRLGRRHERRRPGYSGALHQQVHSVQHGLLLAPEAEFDAGGRKPLGVRARRAVDADHLDPPARERERGRAAGAREPEDDDAVQRNPVK